MRVLTTAPLLGALAAALAACGGSDGGAGGGMSDAARSEAALIFMNDVMQTRAELIWNSAGYIIDANGERDLSPTTDEGWEEVRLGALAVMEAGETLKTADFARDQESWVAFSQGIVDAGGLAVAAAEAQDPDQVFEVGAQLYRVCVACHQFYRVGEYAEPE